MLLAESSRRERPEPRQPMRSAPRSSRINDDKTSEKGAATVKLTTMTQVTVDGVMQGNGGASDEDRRNGFERGGWAMGVADSETMTLINETYRRADAFLFGRRTYELFAGYWGAEERARAAAEDPRNHPITAALNTKPKYLVSNTITEPRWADTTVLSGDVAKAIGELKAKPGGELQVHGSGALIRWLLDNDLVDELTLLIVPVVLGQGARLFPDAGPDIALQLVESRADSKGVTIQVYRPAGRPRYAAATANRDDG
jgi:dihydrofolate reductase